MSLVIRHLVRRGRRVAGVGVAALVVLAPATPRAESPAADPAGRQLLDELSRRSQQLGTFQAACSLDVKAKMISGWRDFGGEGRIWAKAPDLVRVETDRMKGKGFKGGGPAKKIICRGDEYLLCEIVNPDAPLLFVRTQPVSAGAHDRFQWVPGADYIRPPAPLPDYIAGLVPVAVHNDTLRGRPAKVVDIRAPQGRGGIAGDDFTWWIDAERFCLMREVVRNNNEVRATFEYTEPKELKPDLFLPTAMTHINSLGDSTMHVVFLDIKVGEPIDDAVFIPEGTVVE